MSLAGILVTFVKNSERSVHRRGRQVMLLWSV